MWHPGPGRRRPWRLALGAATLASDPASAHVKWFCTTVDVTRPPVPITAVLSPLFLLCWLGFGLLVFAGLSADGWLSRRWPRALSISGPFEYVEEAIVRIAIALYCLLLWDDAAMVPWSHVADTILTPELVGRNHLIDGLQITVAVAVASRWTCPLAAAALLALMGLGIAQYGIFHMTDYVYFVGYAAYLVLSSPWMRSRRRWRLSVLGASLGFSLMWTAVEKFLYPQWTAAILLNHPDIAAGFPIRSVVVIAGFVEFSLAFYLLAGRGLLRLGALALGIVFVSAMPEFGHLDVVGHLPILAILAAIILRGATPLQDGLWRRLEGPWPSAVAICALYFATLSALMAMYYGLQLTAAA